MENPKTAECYYSLTMFQVEDVCCKDSNLEDVGYGLLKDDGERIIILGKRPTPRPF